MLNEEYSFLKDGGEMGKLIRSIDWSKTAIGPVDGWSQSLRIATSIMLCTPFPMYIAWGKEYIQLYNDGYRPILGSTKHPRAMGSSSRETFAEIWHIIGEMFDGVMQGRAVGFPGFMLPLERHGFVEECFFDFSYSPIYKEDDTVGGVLVTVVETTENLKNIRKLEESNRALHNSEDNLKNLIAHAPVAMAVLTGPRFIVEIVNDRVLELWGKTYEQVIDKPVLEGIPEVVGQGIEELLLGVFTTGERFVAKELAVELFRNGRLETAYLNFVYEALRNANNNIYGVAAAAIEVTEQVNSRLKSEEAEERARLAIQAANIGTFDYDLLSGQIITSPRLDAIMGIGATPDHLEYFSLFHPEDVPIREKAHREALVTGTLFYEARILKPEEVRWIQVQGQTYYDREGTAFRMLGTMRDITEEKTNKEALDRAQWQLQVALSAGLVSTYFWDIKRNHFVADENLARLFSVAPEVAAKGLPLQVFVDAIHPEDAPGVMQLVEKAIKTGVDYEADYRVRDITGKTRWVAARGKVLYENGEAISFPGTLVDITDRKNAEQDLKAREERFRLMADAMPQKVWTANEKGQLLYYNQHWRQYTDHDFGLSDWALKDIIHPDDWEETRKGWQYAVETGKDFEREQRFMRKDGQFRWHLTRAVAQKDEITDSILWIGTATDIDERKKEEEKKDEFLNIASHELRTPITSMKGFLQLLQRKVKDSDDKLFHELTFKANRQLDKLTHLINDLLDVTRINTGKLQLDLSEFDLGYLINESIEENAALSETHRIVLEGETCFKIVADKLRLEQVIVNYLSNAIKYSPGEQQIILSVRHEAGFVKLFVTDFGVGIPADKQQLIFNRFFRAVDTHKFAGLGLGLYICKQIITMHGGEVGFSSKAGEGSTFWFSIPAGGAHPA